MPTRDVLRDDARVFAVSRDLEFQPKKANFEVFVRFFLATDETWI